jgi:hypothetical protein
MTRATPKDSAADALATCSPEQLAELQAGYESARAAVSAHLTEQDRRLGLAWAALWDLEAPRLESGVGVGDPRGGDSP